jgi:hypothetical protein
MPETRIIIKREFYYDRSGQKRWKTVKQSQIVYSLEEREEQIVRTRRFLRSGRFIALPIAAAIYLAVTLSWHREEVANYKQWLNFQREISPIVCITLYGRAYHTSGHYRARSMDISLFDAIRLHKFACHVCRPPTMMLTDEQRTRSAPSYFDYGFMLVFSSMLYLFVVNLTFRVDATKKETNIK